MSAIHQKSVLLPGQRDSKLVQMENSSVSQSPSAFLSQISQAALKSTISNASVSQSSLVREYDAQIDDINKQIELQREKLLQKKASSKQKYTAVPEEKQEDCPPQLKFIDTLFSDVFSKTQKVLDLMNCKEENFLFGRSVHSIQNEANSLNSKLKETGWTESFKKNLQDVGIKCQESSEFLEKVELEVNRINQRINDASKEEKAEKIEEFADPSEIDDQTKHEEEALIKRINFLEDVFVRMDTNLDNIIDHFLQNGASLHTVHQKLNILNIEAVQNNYSSYQLQQKLEKIEDNSKIEGLINTFNEALKIRICEAKKVLNKKLLSDQESKIKNQSKHRHHHPKNAKTFQGVELNLDDSDSGDDNDLLRKDKLTNPLIDHHLLSYTVAKNSSQKSQESEKIHQDKKITVEFDLEKMSSKSESSCGDDYGVLSFISNKSNNPNNLQQRSQKHQNLHNLKYRQNMFDQLIQRRRQNSQSNSSNPIIPVIQLVHATIETTANPTVKDRVVFQPNNSSNSVGSVVNPQQGNNQPLSKSSGTPISIPSASNKAAEIGVTKEGIPKSQSNQQSVKQPSIPANTITPPPLASNKDKSPATEIPSISLDQPKEKQEVQKDKTLPAKTNSSTKLLGQLTSQSQQLAENVKKDSQTPPASVFGNSAPIPAGVQSQEQPQKQQPPMNLSNIFHQNIGAQSVLLGDKSFAHFESQNAKTSQDNAQKIQAAGGKSEVPTKPPQENQENGLLGTKTLHQKVENKSDVTDKIPKGDGLFGFSNPILKVENKSDVVTDNNSKEKGGLFGFNFPTQKNENKSDAPQEGGLFGSKPNKPEGAAAAVSIPGQQENTKVQKDAEKQQFPFFAQPPQQANNQASTFGSLFQQPAGQQINQKPPPPSEANFGNQQKPLAPEGAEKEVKQQTGLFSQSQPQSGGLFSFQTQQPKNDQEENQGQFNEPTSLKKKPKGRDSSQLEGLMNSLSVNNASDSITSIASGQQSTPLFKATEMTGQNENPSILGGLGFGQSVMLPKPASASATPGIQNINSNSLLGLSGINFNPPAQSQSGGGLFGNNNANNNNGGGMANLFGTPLQAGQSSMFGFQGVNDQSKNQQQQPILGIQNMDGKNLKAFSQPTQALNTQPKAGQGMFGNSNAQPFGMGLPQSSFGTGQGQFGATSFGGNNNNNNNNSAPIFNQAFKQDISKLSFGSQQSPMQQQQQPQQQQQQQQGQNSNNMFQGFMGQNTGGGLFGGMNNAAPQLPSASNNSTSMFKPRK